MLEYFLLIEQDSSTTLALLELAVLVTYSSYCDGKIYV